MDFTTQHSPELISCVTIYEKEKLKLNKAGEILQPFSSNLLRDILSPLRMAIFKVIQ